MNIWIKFAGALAVLTATTIMGWQKAALYENRVLQLRDCRQGLAFMQTSITYGVRLMPQALEEAGRRVKFPVSQMFLLPAEILQKQNIPIEEAWLEGLKAVAQHSALQPADLVVLESLAPGLGFGDTDSQKRQLAMVDFELKSALQKAEAEAAGNTKMWRYLGVLGGIFLIIILL